MMLAGGGKYVVQDQVKKLKEEYGLERVVFVGDRGMVTQTKIDEFIDQGGVDWITALKSGSIRKLRAEGDLQLGLFDEKNLFEFSSPLYPGERLVACRNDELAKRRVWKRQSLIDATKKELNRIQRSVRAGRLDQKAEIGLRVGRIINKYKVAKHFKLIITDTSFHYRVRKDSVQAEAALDGIYVIRTSLDGKVISPEDTVRHYKRLARIEKAFRSMKTVDLMVRPIYHYTENRVRAHIFLCMLAYYDPVAPAQPTPEARRKAQTKTTPDGLPVQSFNSLLQQLATVIRNRCRRLGAAEDEAWQMTTQHNPLQRRAFELLKTL